jgi:autotransporter-associated beta strand protein
VTPTPISSVVAAGANTNYTLTVAPLGGFTNTVNLSVTGLPPNTAANFNSSSVNAATLNFASTNITLSIQTSNSTPVGSYTLNIIGTSGSVSHTNKVTLVVGSFALSAAPPSQTVSAGNSAPFTATVTTNSGYSGSVSFGISGLPANTSAAFSPGSLSGAGNSTLNVTTAASTPAGNYTLTIFATNGAVTASTTVSLTVVGATPVWTGGSSSDSYWSDATNWGGIAIAPGNPLIFSGSNRPNNTNDTASATAYSNIVFSAGTAAFVLKGNPITLNGNITNNSANPQTVGLGLNFSNSLVFNGASNTLIISGGLTNRFGASGSTTLTLAGTGQLVNQFASPTSPGGTNALLLSDVAANWTLLDNASSTAIAVPWVFQVNNGTFNFGAAGSAPVLNTSTANGTPSDNQIGAVSGANATFNMINGTLTTSARFDTATSANSTGTINQTGGTLNIGNQFQGANGSNPGEVSIVYVQGGTLNVGGGSGVIYVASRGTGTLTVGGSGIVNCGKLDISRNANGNAISSVGTVNLDGGTLMVTSVTNASANQQTGGSPSATFNFNGGTLMAKAGAAAGFFHGSTVAPITPIAAIVKIGGAVIDDGGNAISILEPLQHDSSLGSTADGGLTKLNTGTLTLPTVSTYNGDTLVSAGTLALTGSGSIGNGGTVTVAAGAALDASGRSDGMLAIAAGQTLTGNGTVKGNVIVSNSATLAPGGALTTLKFNNNLTLNAGSVTVMEVSKSPTTNDVAQVVGNLVYSGTLVITNIGAGAFSAGDSFKLFNASGYSGAFTNVVPVIPAVNLAWDTSTLTNDGTLRVVSAPTSPPQIGSMAVNGTSVIVSGSNGVPNWTYYVLTATNPALPLSQWTPVATNNFDVGGNFNFTADATNQVEFYLLELQ